MVGLSLSISADEYRGHITTVDQGLGHCSRLTPHPRMLVQHFNPTLCIGRDDLPVLKRGVKATTFLITHTPLVSLKGSPPRMSFLLSFCLGRIYFAEFKSWLMCVSADSYCMSLGAVLSRSAWGLN